MSAAMCRLCRRRKLVSLENGPRGVRACSLCDGDVVRIVVDREAKKGPES